MWTGLVTSKTRAGVLHIWIALSQQQFPPTSTPSTSRNHRKSQSSREARHRIITKRSRTRTRIWIFCTSRYWGKVAAMRIASREKCGETPPMRRKRRRTRYSSSGMINHRRKIENDPRLSHSRLLTSSRTYTTRPYSSQSGKSPRSHTRSWTRQISSMTSILTYWIGPRIMYLGLVWITRFIFGELATQKLTNSVRSQRASRSQV